MDGCFGTDIWHGHLHWHTQHRFHVQIHQKGKVRKVELQEHGRKSYVPEKRCQKTTPNPGNKAKDASKRVQLNHWQVIWFAKASQGRLPGYLAGPLFFQQSGPFVAVQIRFLERKHVRDHKKNNTQKKSDNINKG